MALLLMIFGGIFAFYAFKVKRGKGGTKDKLALVACVVLMIILISNTDKNVSSSSVIVSQPPIQNKTAAIEEKEQLKKECKISIDSRKAEYQKLMNAHEYEDAVRVVSVCSNVMGDQQLSQWVKDATVSGYIKDIKNQKLNPRARIFAIESLTREYPDKGKEYEKLSSDLLVMANKKDAAEEAKKRKSEGVRIGMSREEAAASSWGKPQHINTTTRASGTREQWVYGDGNYLYFNDGVLTSIQN